MKRILLIFAAKFNEMLIGREIEKKELLEAFESEYSQFVAVYGRRRVGKTFLIRETFNYKFTFEHSGVANGNNRKQLRAFRDSLVEAGMEKMSIPVNWMDAFGLLRQFIKQSPEAKKVIFIDEIPWMDTPRSDFLSSLEYFWNAFASDRKDVLLIICGSATSWIINKVLKNHGGLHNRVTCRISLQPFSLYECEQYMRSRNIGLSRYDLLELYMVFGGVPFYWSLLERGKSVAQSIDRLVFLSNGKLHDEFYELYDSLFKTPEQYISVVTALGEAGAGLNREELVARCNLDGNGKTTRILNDLQECGFIKKIPTFGLKNMAMYKLIDNYTLFYLKFVKENETNDEQFWSHSYLSPVRTSWVGLAFERVCFQHIPQIKKALGISGVVTNVYAWRIGKSVDGEAGAQIDMLIDRADNMVNICEMKFSKTEYTVTKEDADSLHHKAKRFVESVGKGKSISLTMITVNGITHTGHWGDIHNNITAEDLFEI